MKDCRIVWVTVGLLFFASCAKEKELSVKNNPLTDRNKIQWTPAELKVLHQMRGENYKLSMEEINLLANEEINFLDGKKPVKSGSSRRIETIMPLTSGEMQKSTLRSSSESESVNVPDTLAYAINFADSTGFTIIAADTRVENPVLATVYSGTLGSEITNYPGMGIFLQGAELYIEQSILDFEQSKDSLMRDISAKLYYANSDSSATKIMPQEGYVILSEELLAVSPWVTTYTKGPLSPVEWGQGNEFGGDVFWDNVRYKKSCGTCPAGCVAVAIAHIMSYWKYPTTMGSSTYDWSLLNQYTGLGTSESYKTWTYNKFSYNVPLSLTNQIADLMEKIGTAVGMNWDCNSSGAGSDDAIQYLKSRGFSGGTKKNYDYSSVVSSLNNNRPVYIDGYAQTASDGHAWVVDGYMNRMRTVTYTVVISGSQNQPVLPSNMEINQYLGNGKWSVLLYTQEYENRLHNNWGWAGLYNGWFLANCFDSHAESLENPYGNDHSANFQYKNTIYVDLNH